MAGVWKKFAFAFFFVFVLFLGFGKNSVVAEYFCPNNGPLCSYCPPENKNDDGSCNEWVFHCCDGGARPITCPAGYYACSYGCCPIGSPPPSGGGDHGGCIIPTHKNLKVDWDYSETQVRFSWEQIVPLVYQNVYVSDTLAAVVAGCAYRDDTDWGQYCIVKERDLDGAVLEYLIDKSLFTAGTPYFFNVNGKAVGSCRGSETTVSMSSCQLSQMVPFTLEVGQTRSLTVQTTDDQVSRMNISRVEFSSEPAGVVSLNPAVDYTRPTYSTTVKGVNDGQTTVTAKVYSPYDWMTTEPICSGSVAVTVGEAPVSEAAGRGRESDQRIKKRPSG